MQKPTYDELLDMLDNVSAALENAVLAHGAAMTPADRKARDTLACAARMVCDRILRPLSKEEAEAQFLFLVRKYGLQWTAEVPRDAHMMMARVNDVLSETDRRRLARQR